LWAHVTVLDKAMPPLTHRQTSWLSTREVMQVSILRNRSGTFGAINFHVLVHMIVIVVAQSSFAAIMLLKTLEVQRG
jgi:hypothetical protein